MAPDVTAQIFWLKNRRPEFWRDKPAEKPADTNQGGIVLMPSVDAEEAADDQVVNVGGTEAVNDG